MLIGREIIFSGRSAVVAAIIFPAIHEAIFLRSDAEPDRVSVVNLTDGSIKYEGRVRGSADNSGNVVRLSNIVENKVPVQGERTTGINTLRYTIKL